MATAADGLEDCRSIADDADRLACYDRLTDAQAPSRQHDEGSPAEAAALPTIPPAVAPSGAPSSGPDVPTPEDLFGRDAVAAEAMVRESAGIGRLEEIRRQVLAVQFNPEGKLVVTLDNGQIWEQLDSPSPRLAAGEAVSVRRAAFGSYLLTTEATPRGVRVRRLR